MLRYLLLVAAGGAIGALCRWGIGLLTARLWGSGFAWGTLTVNLAGCFLIGFIFAVTAQRSADPAWRLFLMTGFLGALTTFSSYSLESVQFARAGQIGTFAANVLVNNVAGLALTVIGLWAGYRV